MPDSIHPATEPFSAVAEPEPTIAVLPKPQEATDRFTWGKTLASIALYLLAYYVVFDGKWDFILLLVAILFFHELGHFIAMKAYGYKDVNMFFVPLIGAYVTGEAQQLSQRNRIVVLLAGPVPGMLFGLACWWLVQNNLLGEQWSQVAIMFVVLNAFNLLPISPMDGGQVMVTLFLERSKNLLIGFYLLSIVAVLYFFSNSWVMASVIVLVLLLRIYREVNLRNLQQKLSGRGLDLQQSYDDLTDEEYTDIRYELLMQNSRTLGNYNLYETDSQEEKLIPWVKAVLLPPVEKDLKPWQRLMVVLFCVGLLLLVFALWKRWI
jgi:stage IV sporulation protein FB